MVDVTGAAVVDVTGARVVDVTGGTVVDGALAVVLALVPAAEVAWLSPAAFPAVAKSVVVVGLTGAVVAELPDAEGATDVVVGGVGVTSVDEVDRELTAVVDVVDGTDAVVVVLGGNVVAGLEVVTGAADVVVLAGDAE